MELTAAAIAEYLGGDVVGNPEITVTEFAKIEDGKPGALSFLSNPKYEHYIYTTDSSIVLVNKSFTPSQPVASTMVRVEDAYGALAKLLTFVASKRKRKSGRHPLSVVEDNVRIGTNVYIGAYAYISEGAIIEDNVQIYPHCFLGEQVRIGEDSILYSGVKVYADCEIGQRVIVHSGAVIGSDGFGFALQEDGSRLKIPQMGIVEVGDDVEIGANTTIDRASMGSTVIERGVKLDNLVQIAHNVTVGEDTVMAAQTGVAGSTKVGKRCMFGGQVGIVGHINVADDVKVGAQTGIASSVRKEDCSVMGYPAMDLRLFYRVAALNKRLPELFADVDRLKKAVEELHKAEQQTTEQ